MNIKRMANLADEFACYMAERLSETKSPLNEGLASIAYAVANIIETTAQSLTSTTASELAELFKSGLDEYFNLEK